MYFSNIYLLLFLIFTNNIICTTKNKENEERNKPRERMGNMLGERGESSRSNLEKKNKFKTIAKYVPPKPKEDPSVFIINKFYETMYQETKKPDDEKRFDYFFSTSNIVNQTFTKIGVFRFVSKSPLRKRPRVNFSQSRGVDVGGLTQEWIHQFSSKVFHPDFKLFRYADEYHDAVEICPGSTIFNKLDRAHKFYVLGLMAAFSVYHNCRLTTRFSVPILKAILGKPIDIQDVERIDPSFYQTLENIRMLDVSKIGLNFTSHDRKWPKKEFNLKPSGKKLPVTNDNKQEYINLLIKFRYEELVKDEIKEFCKGFWSLIPNELLVTLDENILSLLISGKDKIDINYWKEITNFHGCDEKPYLKYWFWQVVEILNETQRLELLHFVTGSTRMPRRRSVQDFEFRVRFRVSNKIIGNTCSSVLYLPLFEEFNLMRDAIISVLDNSGIKRKVKLHNTS